MSVLDYGDVVYWHASQSRLKGVVRDFGHWT